jgi:hypothetical protein
VGKITKRYFRNTSSTISFQVPVAAGSIGNDTLNGVAVTTTNTNVTPITTGAILVDADGNVTIA